MIFVFFSLVLSSTRTLTATAAATWVATSLIIAVFQVVLAVFFYRAHRFGLIVSPGSLALLTCVRFPEPVGKCKVANPCFLNAVDGFVVGSQVIIRYKDMGFKYV